MSLGSSLLKAVLKAVLGIIGVFLSLVVLGMLVTTPAGQRAPTGTSPKPEPATATAAAQHAGHSAPSAYLDSKWVYSQDDDPMSNGLTKSARIRSSNQVELDFPYGGPQRATLWVRWHPRFGKQVIFYLERGQILCHTFGEDCNVLVRFGDEPATPYSAAPSNDGSTEIVFLQNYARFFDKLTKATRVRISVRLYQQGEQNFEFDVTGFDPQQWAARSPPPDITVG